jgi:hypothetical protein
MSGFNYATVLKQGELETTLCVKQHQYNNIEVTFKRDMKTESGRTIVDNRYTMFFTEDEFKQFFKPLIDDLTVRLNDDNKS